MSNHPAIEYWLSGDGLSNITPQNKAWPEGDHFPGFMRTHIGAKAFQRKRTVVEFGCGVGRLAQIFDPAFYLGVDICRAAIAAAKVRVPSHRFETMEPDGEIAGRDIFFAHTVLLHVPDDALPDVLSRISHKRVVISEIMGRSWRRDGHPPVFNREPSEYIAAFAAAGYSHSGIRHLPYQHYCTKGRDVRMTVLDFTLEP